MKLSDIREWVWPLLEPIETRVPSEFNEKDIQLNNEDNIKLAYDLAIKYYEGEAKRKSDVEGKSTIFIGTVGFLITILLNITKDLVAAPGPLIFFNSLAFSIIIIYLCRVVWFAIKVLQRRSYYTINPNDFITGEIDYKKRLILKLINCTRKNSIVINLKVDYMTMAQEYYKRAIVCIALYASVLIIYSSYQHNFLNWIVQLFNFISKSRFQGESFVKSQLVTYLQSLATGLLVFTSIIGAYLSVHYGNIYNTLFKSYYKILNIQKELFDSDGSRESIVKNARLVEEIVSNYVYDYSAIDNVLSKRMRDAAKYILLLAVFSWLTSLWLIVKQDFRNTDLIMFFYNSNFNSTLVCFILTIIATAICWKYLFNNKYMFTEFPMIIDKLDVSKDSDMFGVMLESSIVNLHTDNENIRIQLFFSVPYSGFDVVPELKYLFKDGSNQTVILDKKTILKPEIEASLSIKGMQCVYIFPIKENIKEFDISIEVTTNHYKGFIKIHKIKWDALIQGFYTPNKQIIMRFLTEEKEKASFGK